MYHLPDAHTVCEGVGAIGWPDATVLLEHCDVPHELVHDLRKLDGVRGRARAATGCSGAAVSHMVLMVRAVEVLSVPASRKKRVSPLFFPCLKEEIFHLRGEDDGLSDHLAV